MKIRVRRRGDAGNDKRTHQVTQVIGVSSFVQLRDTSLKKAKKACLLSPVSSAPRRIAVVADEERSRPKFD